MSFRSRSRTVQPVMQRRSLSGSRLPSTISSYTSSNRPMSSAYPSTTSYNSYNPYSSISSRDSIYSSTTSPRNSSYYNGNGSSRRDSYNGSSVIYKNPYASDRYVSPYTSYDNGITTAGLSIKSSYGTNGFSNKGYTPSYPTKSLSRSNILSGSNTSLNSYSSTPATVPSSANIGRSQSFRDHTTERKSRGVRRNASLKSDRSLSVSSEKSEGYEVSKSTS